jgi:hypothetical protein
MTSGCYGQINLEPTSTDELEQAEGLATARAQSGKENTGVNDDLRLLHGGIIYTTTTTSNYVGGGLTARHALRGSPRRLPGRPGGDPPGPPQTRTSAMNASGSSEISVSARL